MPDYIGPATPTQSAKIRLGHFTRAYGEVNNFRNAPGAEEDAPYGLGAEGGPHIGSQGGVGLNVGPAINYPPSGRTLHYDDPWQAFWIPDTLWKPLPNISEIKREKKQEVGKHGGVEQVTIEIENILYPEQGGGYHVRERGALSALRALLAEGDPVIEKLKGEWEEELAANEWQDVFNHEAQVTIYQGFVGSGTVKIFTGLIEEWDSTSRPDKITLTLRSFGKIFDEAHFMGDNKDPIINTPVVFVDKEQASKKEDVALEAAGASTEKAGHGEELAVDGKNDTYWESTLEGSAEDTQFIEIGLPQGEYRNLSLFIPAGWAGMTAYISLHPAEIEGGQPPDRDHEKLAAAGLEPGTGLDTGGWVDLAQIGAPGGGTVPGYFGGVPYINKVEDVAENKNLLIQLDANGANYEFGVNTVLRVSFTNLPSVVDFEVTGYSAAVAEFTAQRLELNPEGANPEWVVTNDISDIIRQICIWAGFKQWDIPDTGAKLPIRIIATQGETYAEVIDKVCEGIGFTFFVGDPTTEPIYEPEGGAEEAALGQPSWESLGVPVFRKTRATLAEAEDLPTITDRTLLTAIEPKQEKEPLTGVIRVYGISKSAPPEASKEAEEEFEEAIASGDLLVCTLSTPWKGKLAGIDKQAVFREFFFSTLEDVRNGALFLALQQALESMTATIEFPALPGLCDVDSHVLLYDLASGIASRLYILERTSTFVDGEKRKAIMTLVGSLVDTPDVRDIVNVIEAIKSGEMAEGDELYSCKWLTTVGTNLEPGEASELGYG